MSTTAIVETKPLLRADAVSVDYVVRQPLTRRKLTVHAVREVSLAVQPGGTAALVGESGCGKSTLARCLAGLQKPTQGAIWVGDRNIRTASAGGWQAIRRQVQLVLQDSATALNPSFTAMEIVAEPLLIQREGSSEQRKRSAFELMESVGFPTDLAARRPAQLSGGQRQRLAVARALALKPSVLVLDEPFAGLDLLIQQRILDLLADLRRRHGLTYLLISHDLRLVSSLADEIFVMLQGRIVERGVTRTILNRPQHSHTRALLDAVPGAALVRSVV